MEPTCIAQDTEVGRAEVTDLGFSADQVLAPVEGTYEAPFEYRDGVTAATSLTVTAAWDGSPIFVRTWSPPPEEPALECNPPSLELGVAVTFTTADGAFAEHWTQHISESELYAATTFYGDIPVSDLEGDWDPGDGTALSLWVNVDREGEAPATYGELVRVFQADDGTPLECGFASWNMDPVTGCP